MSKDKEPGSDITADTPAHAETRVLTVSKQYRKSGVVTKDEVDEEFVEVPVPHADIPMAEVGYDARMTLNMGNYETCQVGISVRLPCYPVELEEAHATAKKFVDLRLNKEVDALREYRKSKAGA